MSVIVTSLIVAGGVLLGRWIARGNAEPGVKPGATPAAPDGRAPETADAKTPERDHFQGFPCHLGDVLLRSGGDEAWLAGALVFSETETTSALFVAPEAGKDVAIYVRSRPSLELAWLSAIDLAILSEPPTSIEHLGTRFERKRRLPLRAERLGTGAPSVGDQVIVAEYTAGSEWLVVISGSGTSHAFRGASLEEGMYEVIPSGKATL